MYESQGCNPDELLYQETFSKYGYEWFLCKNIYPEQIFYFLMKTTILDKIRGRKKYRIFKSI